MDLPENAGPVAETAFFHRPTATLVTTDSVIYVPDEPPPIFSTYFKPDQMADPDFWAKSVIQAVFLPLREKGDAPQTDPRRRWPGYGSVQGRLLRAPILRAFADARTLLGLEPDCQPPHHLSPLELCAQAPRAKSSLGSTQSLQSGSLTVF